LKAAKHIDQRRLAGAIGANKPQYFAGIQRESNIVKCSDAAEANRDVLDR
jgi:hypothetical protein